MNTRDYLTKKYQGRFHRSVILAIICFIIGIVSKLVFDNIGQSLDYQLLRSLTPILTGGFPTVGIICVIVAVFSAKKFNKIDHLFCKHCGEKYNYDTDVACKIKGRDTRKGGMFSDGNFKKYVTVAFQCKCSACRSENHFEKEFNIGVAGTDHRGELFSRDLSLNSCVEKYFESL